VLFTTNIISKQLYRKLMCLHYNLEKINIRNVQFYANMKQPLAKDTTPRTP